MRVYPLGVCPLFCFVTDIIYYPIPWYPIGMVKAYIST